MPLNLDFDIARLGVVLWQTGQRAVQQCKWNARKHGNAVVGFLPNSLGRVAKAVERQGGKGCRLAFDLLQEQDVGLIPFHPALNVGFALAN
jgi:hypothetical protein